MTRVSTTLVPRGSCYIPSFSGHRPEDLVLHHQLAELALGLLQPAVFWCQGLALQPLKAASHKLIAPGLQPVGFHAHLAAELLQTLPAQQAHDRVGLLAGRPPILVWALGCDHRSPSVSHVDLPLLSGVQGNRVRRREACAAARSWRRWLSGRPPADLPGCRSWSCGPRSTGERGGRDGAGCEKGTRLPAGTQQPPAQRS